MEIFDIGIVPPQPTWIVPQQRFSNYCPSKRASRETDRDRVPRWVVHAPTARLVHVPPIVHRAFVSNRADDRMSADRIERSVSFIEFI
jgi:hypothetical protein